MFVKFVILCFVFDQVSAIDGEQTEAAAAATAAGGADFEPEEVQRKADTSEGEEEHAEAAAGGFVKPKIHAAVWNQFITAMKEKDIGQMHSQLKEHPELITATDFQEHTAVDIALHRGQKNALLFLLDFGGQLRSEGFSPGQGFDSRLDGHSKADVCEEILETIQNFARIEERLCPEIVQMFEDFEIKNDYRKFVVEMYRRMMVSEMSNMFAAFRALDGGLVSPNSMNLAKLINGAAGVASRLATSAARAGVTQAEKLLEKSSVFDSLFDKIGLSGKQENLAESATNGGINAATNAAGNTLQQKMDMETVRKFSWVFQHLDVDDRTFASELALAATKLRVRPLLGRNELSIYKEFAKADVAAIVRFLANNPAKQFGEDLIEKSVQFLGDEKKREKRQSDERDEVEERKPKEFKKPVWVRDDYFDRCQKCNKEFSVFTRRHHCRKCGALVCDACSPHKEMLPFTSAKEPERVCKDCATRVLGQQ